MIRVVSSKYLAWLEGQVERLQAANDSLTDILFVSKGLPPPVRTAPMAPASVAPPEKSKGKPVVPLAMPRRGGWMRRRQELEANARKLAASATQ